jgi:hypothetical protein
MQADAGFLNHVQAGPLRNTEATSFFLARFRHGSEMGFSSLGAILMVVPSLLELL